ncbi:MAG: sugar ABC transporter ATP-binding protein [Spirochaetaceae bacterium]|nr:MAG: sugar ABC transporter ATP-binding protein [Spirochaetaceae bacterium]
MNITGVHKYFPGVHALSDVSLDLQRDEVHAVCGENGAGKSTLMKIIAGVYRPDDGLITLEGQPFVVHEPNEAYRKGIAIIYQESSLFPDMTVLENIFIGHEIRKPVLRGLRSPQMIDYRAMREKANAVFNRLGISVDLDRTVRTIGVATKQMIEIAKALSFDSRILILDEPTAALANREVDALFKTIRSLKSEGVSMLYISHRLDEIFEIADRVTVLRDGKHVATERVAATDRNQLVSWMVGRSLDNLYPKEDVEIGEVIFEAQSVSLRGVLEDISFNARRGEIVGISGLAGSGRTELALSLCGLVPPDSGTIKLNGKAVRIHSYREALEHGIAYVSEDRQVYGLVLPMTLKVNITHKAIRQITNLFSVINRGKEEQIAAEYMHRLAIKAPDSEFVVNKLSGGNQQKVSVAKSLAVEPEVLIVDEPTRGVDVGAKSELHRIISELAKSGKAIIMISSDLPEIIGMCDRTIVLKRGRKMGELLRNEMNQEQILHMAL